MAGGIVGWHFFDVETGRVPEESLPSILPGGGEGRIVVLAATPFARSDGWASRAAVSIAKGWSDEGLRVFLMDLGLDAPSLHEVLDLPNDEGVADAFLYGASVQHIARPALDGAVFFASAGTAPGDIEEVLGHPRWNDLAGGFSEADATLLLFLPCEVPGAGKILSRATDIVFLSAQGESADAHLGPASIKVVSMLGPLGSPPEEIEAIATSPDEESQEDLDSVGDPGPEPDAAEEEVPEEVTGGSDDSGFDFGGGLELADGFGESVPEEEPDEDEGFGSGLGDGADLGGDLGLVDHDGEGESSDDDAHDLGIGADFSGELEGSGFGDDEESDEAAPPDFGSDFVEMPDDDGGGFEPDGFEDQGEFGGALVQGPDFGSPAEESTGFETAGEVEDEAPGSDDGVQDERPEEEKPRPAPRRRPPPKKKRPIGLMVGVVALVAAVGAVAGTAFGFLNIPGLIVLQEYTGNIPDPALTLGGAQATDPVLGYSLVVFDDYGEDQLDELRQTLDALEGRLPNVLFYLAPVDVDGTLTYLLLAGQAADRIEAENLRTPLAEQFPREDPEAWVVRETPRAFYLGERETLEEAREYLATAVAGEGIHGYVLLSTYEDGSQRYVIFSGGFRTVDEARPLQLLLRRAGFTDAPLIERRGLFPG